MPTTLPVPSKGALRALRHIALGTSCTIAVGAGLLTEDRRRRIQSAQQAYDNAQTLKSFKSSRHYHSAAIIESFELDALRHSDDAYWLPSSVSKSKINVGAVQQADDRSAQEKPAAPLVRKRKFPKAVPLRAPIGTNLRGKLGEKSSSLSMVPEVSVTSSSTTRDSSHQKLGPPSVETQHSMRHQQDQLALEIGELLNGTSQAPDIEAAASKFLSALVGLEKRDKGMDVTLVEAAIRIFERCGSKDVQEQILLAVSSHGPIEEAQFLRLEPASTMSRMFKRVRGETLGKQYFDEPLLKAIVSIYLTIFTNRPSVLSNEHLHIIGETLCRATCRAGLYDLCGKVYARLAMQRGDRPIQCVSHLIEALHAKGRQVFRHFRLVYSQSSPNKVEFRKIGNLVLSSLLVNNEQAKMLDFLAVVSQMAETKGLRTLTSWFLRVLGHEWRTNGNIKATCAMFETMVPQIVHTSHPQALYGAIIQFCVEAGDDVMAMHIYRRLVDLHPESIKDVRVLGHLAYAKALRFDWEGTKAELHNIHQLNPIRSESQQEEFGAIFTPILKKYAASHSVTETENFMRIAIAEWNLSITPFIFNLMVGVYGGTKEIESMVRWIELASHSGRRINPGTVNTLISRAVGAWNFSFLEAYRLYRRICGLGQQSGNKFTNAETVLILKRIAVSKAGNNAQARNHLDRLKNIEASDLDNQYFQSASDAVTRKMTQAHREQRPRDVLRIYKEAQAGPASLDSSSLLLAVKASLNLHDQNVEEALDLIKEANDRGQNVAGSVAWMMVHRMQHLGELRTSAQMLSASAKRDIETLKDRGVEVQPMVLTQAMSILLRYRQYRQVIELWDTTSMGASTKVDLVTLTILLQAYLELHRGTGVRWVMKMLVVHKLVPDTKFKSVVRNARSSAKKAALQSAANADLGFQACIEDAWILVGDLRLRLREEKASVKYTTIRHVAAEAQNLASPTSYKRALAFPAGRLQELSGDIAESDDSWDESDENDSEPVFVKEADSAS